MAQSTIKISNIFGGISPTRYFGTDGSYLASLGIDPDFPIGDSGATAIKASGALRPVAYAAFDGSDITGNPYWLLTNPKDTLIYVYQNSGKVTSYTSALGSETAVGTPTSGAGNGAAYYNNYLYFATPTDVARYGPLNGSPTLSQTVWTGSTLGSQTALVNTTYPSIRGSGILPNHVMHVHLDNKLYVADYNNATYPGQGIVHYIKTSKTTNEGDTNDGTTANALDLPFGFLPTAMESYGDDLVIAAIQTTDTVTNQGKSALFFWDTVSNSFYKQLMVDEPVITALKMHNGVLYVFAGKLAATNTAGGGYSVLQYLGGSSFKEIVAFEEGWPPLAGAVDAYAGRIVWGSNVTYPANAACVWAYGSKNDNIPSAIHNIAVSTASATATDGVVTAIKFVRQGTNALQKMVIGWRDGSNVGLDKLSTTYQTHYWRSQTFNIGQPFKILRVVLNFAQALAANMTLIPTIYFDDEATSQAGTTINSTNYASSQRNVVLTSDSFSNVNGKHNFFIELKWSGTALLTVVLPIIIELELLDVSTQ